MPDIPTDMGQLAKKISDFKVEGTEDARVLADMCRALCVGTAALLDIAEYEFRDALTFFDHGSSRRARQVTRALRHAESLSMLASRRAASVFKTYMKVFAEDISRKRGRGGRTFDPEH